MFNIAICDDEPVQRQLLLHMTQQFFDSHNITSSITEFNSGEELILSTNEFDLYFLDIRMEKLTGIETAKKIRKVNKKAEIIFVTALKDYVFDAYDVQAFHYILKPINEERFNDILYSLLSHISKSDNFIMVKTMNQSIKVLLKDILYIEAQLRKIIIHTNDGAITYYHKLSSIEQELSEFHFFRCHKSYIVNLEHVRSYETSFITLDNFKKIYLSKHKYSDFCKAFMYYLKGKEL